MPCITAGFLKLKKIKVCSSDGKQGFSYNLLSAPIKSKVDVKEGFPKLFGCNNVDNLGSKFVFKANNNDLILIWHKDIDIYDITCTALPRV